MAKKMRQITDSIHGTIYLSKLESELTSTPYFYRLHDIYQSSTVYMTFPANRTKRYEHSLGTMELASSMMFSSLSNAENETKIAFFKKLKSHFENIVELALFQSDNVTAPYFTKCQCGLKSIFKMIDFNEDFETIINNMVKQDLRNAIENGCFHDSALDNFQFYPMTEYTIGIGDDVQNFFLYRCILQAIRIVALFHDVGHPPYSHIIESELQALYKKVDEYPSEVENWNLKRVNEFKKILKPYATKNEEESFKCQTFYAHSSSVNSQLHERIGLSLLQSAMNDVIPEFILRIADSEENESVKITKALYYIMIMEFTLAILVEKDIFFESLHKLVDGVLDADRMDYIMRDSLNSGVDWGEIPYKRLINSGKLVWVEKTKSGKKLDEKKRPFIIAYPMKVADDIIDLLVIRYKIFARINFHHRCMKTTVALQSAVRELAEDYLSASSNQECIESDINILWTVLKLAMGERAIRVIQWNDSWLITVLHHALIKINTNQKSKHTVLKENLEEILLNKKRYHSLLKRGSDNKRLVDAVLKKLGLSNEVLDRMEEKERQKYYSTEECDFDVDGMLSSSHANAFEALKRIRRFRDLMEKGDMEILDAMLPPVGNDEKWLSGFMESTLERIKQQGKIEDYKVITNKSRRKTGLPMHRDIFEEIYLYSGSDIMTLDENRVLRPQIETIEKNSPWIFVYYVPPKAMEDTTNLEKYMFDEMVTDIADNLQKRFTELFSSVLYKTK